MAKRDSFLLRLSPATLDAMRRWADDELRSVNSQIEMVLQRALRDAGRAVTPTSSSAPSIEPLTEPSPGLSPDKSKESAGDHD